MMISKKCLHLLIVYFALFAIIFEFNGSDAKPINGSRKRRNKSKKSVREYLTDFGYLPAANYETMAMTSPTELTNAVKKLQKMMGLPVNGNPLDPEMKKFMERSRCGMKDNKLNTVFQETGPQSFKVVSDKWKKNDLTYFVKSVTQDMDEDKQKHIFFYALDIWAKSANLNFYPGQSEEESDIVISFARMEHGDGYPFEGKDGVLAHAFLPGPDRGGDAHFDDDETWTDDGSEGKVDLYVIAAHEFGHSLGIHHSLEEEALMFPWYKGPDRNLRLADDDINAIQYLYGASKRADSINPKGGPARPAPRPGPTPRPVPVPKSPDDRPNPCNTDIDAVVDLRGEVFAFKGKWYWRFDQRGELMDPEPQLITAFFSGLPKTLTHIDAVTVVHGDPERTVYFIGNRFYVLFGNERHMQYPEQGLPLGALGLTIRKVDAALRWKFNDRVYLYSGYEYYRLDNRSQRLMVEKDYPKPIDNWEGVSPPIDAAFSDSNGDTYFFKGTEFWKLEDKYLRAYPDYPQDIGKKWLNCRYEEIKHAPSQETASEHVGDTEFIDTGKKEKKKKLDRKKEKGGEDKQTATTDSEDDDDEGEEDDVEDKKKEAKERKEKKKKKGKSKSEEVVEDDGGTAAADDDDDDEGDYPVASQSADNDSDNYCGVIGVIVAMAIFYDCL